MFPPKLKALEATEHHFDLLLANRRCRRRAGLPLIA
jgi:hypothetical protein